MTAPSRLRTLSLALPGIALLILHARRFWFVTDDAFISFIYARNLAEHGQLVYNLGDRTDGYTNFLWTVLLAGVHRAGGALETWSLWLATALSALTVVLAVRLGERLDPDAPVLRRLLAPLLLGGSGALACWTSGGLETALFTTLVTASVLCALTASPRRDLLLGVLGALAAMTRPEGLLLFALLCGCAAVERRRLPLRAVLAFSLLFGPYFAWHWHYYGFPLPNTYYVKSSGARGETLAQGAFYVGRFAADYGAWLWLPLLVPLRRSLVVLVLSVPFVLYVVSVGGDFMGLHRFLVPLVPLWAVHAERALGRLGARLSGPAFAALCVGFLGSHAVLSARVTRKATTEIGAERGIDTPGFLRKYARDRALVGQWMAPHLRPDDLLTVGGAGAQVWYARARAVDAFGLTDRFIAHEVPAHSARPGHQKFAPDSYLLSRRPTILCHTYYIAPTPHAPSPAEAAMWRARGFHWVSVAIPGLEDPGPYYSFLKRLDRPFGPLPADTSP